MSVPNAPTIERAVLDAPRLPPGEIPGLDRVAQRLARGLAQTLPSYGIEVRVKAGEVRAVRHDTWQTQVAQHAWMRFGLPELATTATVTFPFSFIIAAIDRYYGGDGECAHDPRTLTPAERRCVYSLAGALAPIIGAAWAEMTSFTPKVENVGHAVPALFGASPDETLALMELELTSPTGLVWPLTFVVPQEPLQRLPSVRTNMPPAREVAPAWTRSLQDAVLDVRFPVRTVLTRPDMTLDRLLTLAPGDVIPVLLPAFVPVSVGGRVVGHGTIGEENGRTAIRLERMEGGFGR